MPSLYQRILGNEFERLPEVLRRFHGAPAGARARGVFRVQRGSGWMRERLADLGGLPRAGALVPMQLDVSARGEEESWTRTIGTTQLRTRQSAREGRLVEHHAPWTLEILIHSTPDGMRFLHERCRWHGIALPRCLAPRVETDLIAHAASWFVDVRIGLPLFGLICRYAGEVHPT